MEIDREFLHDMRELRILLEKDILEEHRVATLRLIKSKVTDKKYIDLDLQFKVCLAVADKHFSANEKAPKPNLNLAYL